MVPARHLDAMSAWSPPAIPTKWLVLGIVAYLILLAYAAIVVQEILLALLPGIAFVVLYVLVRFLAAVEAIADALQRIARASEESRDRDSSG